MNSTLKIIISSKKNLFAKYGKNFAKIEKHLTDLVNSDLKRNLSTSIIYIDDEKSISRYGIKSIKNITRRNCKKIVDKIYNTLNPAYLVIFGSQDIIPFMEIINPADDDDSIVPSDLPYACDSPYGSDIKSFIGPSRVVGRIPDIPGKVDLNYLSTVFATIINFKQLNEEKFLEYFAVSTDSWKISTHKSLVNIFGNANKLKISPPSNSGYTLDNLKPLTHFYNCHGSPADANFYGQKDNNYPIAQYSGDLVGKITKGTIVAAECCYGAELYDPEFNDQQDLGIALTYLYNKAISFLGSSTIAYGPSTGQGLADLITQYFIKHVIAGASSGRALLEARQEFLKKSGPHLDPYELKTLAQFYLLGDPSIAPVKEAIMEGGADSVENRRLKLFSKGLDLKSSIMPSKRIEKSESKSAKKYSNEIKDIFKLVNFSGKEKQSEYVVSTKGRKISALAKSMSGNEQISFRTFIKDTEVITNKIKSVDVLVLKQSGNKLLGWRLYHRK
ncbi:MAG: hypothetical protein A2X64_08295 [Ignavibacteria bacterium GWF2_33_9]|nr:MAG: hypothetical protein A2X64_08295 [Ignavibacteria bacterium GWF2_33_9]